MAEHTAGPWHSGEPLLIGRFLIRDDSGEIVAEVTGLPWSADETEANARLIAASPRMADLLVRLRQWDHLAVAGDGPYWQKEIDAVLSEAGREP